MLGSSSTAVRVCDIYKSMAEFQSSKRPPAERQETFDWPAMRNSGRRLCVVIACVMRLSLSTLPWELLSRTILRELWRKDL